MNLIKILIIAIIFLCSCTNNSTVKNFGGIGTTYIDHDQKFVNVTWKDNNLWIVTKKRNDSDTTHNTYYFTEESNFGLIQGKYIIVEN